MRFKQNQLKRWMCRFPQALTIFLTLTLSACGSSTSSGPHQSEPVAALKISALSDEAQTCEGKIREKMVNHTLLFDAVSGLDGYAERANQAIPTLGNPNYQLRLTIGSITSAVAAFSRTVGTKTEHLSYSLSATARGSAAPLALTLSWQVTERAARAARLVTLSQVFQLGRDCNLQLSQSSKESIEPKAQSAAGIIYREKTKIVFLGEVPRVEAKEFLVPQGFTLANLISDLESNTIPPQQQLSFMREFGLVSSRNVTKAKMTKSAFGQTFTLEGSAFDEYLGFVGDRLISHAFSGSNTSGSDVVRLNEAFGAQLWTLPLAIWKANSVGISQPANLSYKLPKDYFLTHDSYILVTNQKLAYDHTAAYFEVSELAQENELHRFRLQEKSPPTFAASAVDEDLASNETIQTELPKIQAVKRAILKKAPHDRQKQISLILNYLGKHYGYDREMEVKNVIHPLTTAEALARGKGVCQHFAVIFTAIARALKIPTRIVVGFNLNDEGPWTDAWVEAQVEPGIWQVLDPQLPSALTATQTRHYLPLVRGRFFESHQFSADELNVAVATARFSFLPID